jgi:ABC-type multidrug transport system fused ATPase/permease subunit
VLNIINSFFRLLDSSTIRRVYKLYGVVLVNGIFETLALVFVFFAFSYKPGDVPMEVVSFIGVDDTDIKPILIMTACLIFVAKVQATYLVNKYVYKSAVAIRSSLQYRLFQKLLRNNLIYLNSKPESYWTQAITLDAYALEGRLITPLFVVITEMSVITIIGGYLFFLDPAFFLVTVALFAIVSYMIFFYNNPKLVTAGQVQQEHEKKLVQLTNGVLSGWREIQVDQVHSYFEDHALNHLQKIEQNNFKALHLGLVPKASLESLIFLLILFFTAFYYFQTTGSPSEEIIATVTVYGLAAYRLLPSISKTIAHFQSLKHASYPLKTYEKELLDVES